MIKDVKDPAEASKKLCATAVKSRKCHDNVTVIVVNLRPEKRRSATTSASTASGEKKERSEKKSSSSSTRKISTTTEKKDKS